eukprot:CAMPEP_0182445034 /NCGR_PEP_ID=MMETSP1172-20130603/3298_1 /TAXON_ID=708627 /ORGANISM="Timspurckia oligopyrenoides, Strain CCMP3278" /LENGTH=509 /DNA_ID=CAMNT_0024640729 /DNA_START=63 /DNA_END=1589 /DNA_ORIENTATION=+
MVKEEQRKRRIVEVKLKGTSGNASVQGDSGVVASDGIRGRWFWIGIWFAIILVSFISGGLSRELVERVGIQSELQALVAGGSSDSIASVGSSSDSGQFKAPTGLWFSKLESGKLERNSLASEAVRVAYEDLARQMLSVFGTGISKALYTDVFELKRCSLCVMIQLKYGAVWLYDPRSIRLKGQLFHQLRLKEALYWIRHAVTRSPRLRSMQLEFVLSVADSVITTDREHHYRLNPPEQPPRPIFGATWCNVSSNLPFPIYFYDLMRRAFPGKMKFRRFRSLSEWDDRVLQYMTGDGTPWENKIPRAVFRGVNRDSQLLLNRSEFDQYCFKVGRSALYALSRDHSSLMDVVVTGSCGGKKIAQAGTMSMFEQQAYRFQIYVDGNGFWADRLPLILLSQSCPVKQNTPCKLFFEPLLIPWEHYIPFEYDFQDLPPNLLRGIKGGDLSRNIAIRSQRWAKEYLSHDAIISFVDTLLTQYGELLLNPHIQIHRDAIKVYPVLSSTYTPLFRKW